MENSATTFISPQRRADCDAAGCASEKKDIPILVRGFLRHFCKQNDKPLLDLAAGCNGCAANYDWPGNVRELRTAIEHGVVMATGAKDYVARSVDGRAPGSNGKVARRGFSH